MKYTGPKVKLSRQLNLPLTPKAVKFMNRNPYPPGMHGSRKGYHGKMSDYKRHLMEKQRLHAQYNVNERQMRNYVHKAIHASGNPVDNLIRKFETRLDAFVLRSGYAKTIYAARQYVNHRHILVNRRWVNISSLHLKPNDVISIKPGSRRLPCFITAVEEMVNLPPAYIERSIENWSAKLLYFPERREVPISCDVPLVIEYYSR
jgi:small subunit ribosomal protein S4